MTTDFRALCTELAEKLDEFDRLLHGAQYVEHPLTHRARAALAEPEPVEPTYEQLVEELGQAYVPCAEAFARAVLDRWGNYLESPDSPPTPIPVSERLPGPEDCDGEGRCWLGGEMFAPGDPTWVLGFPAWAQRFPEIHRYWLPAHALPLPGEDISGKD